MFSLRFLGLLPSDFNLLSADGLAVMGGCGLGAFLVLAVIIAGPLVATDNIMAASELPERFRTEIDRPERPWRKRTSVRHIEDLKAELSAAEDRRALLASVDGYIRWYEERKKAAALDADVRGTTFSLFMLERAYGHFRKHCPGDDLQVMRLVERIDVLYAGDVTAEIRALEERIEALHHEKEETPADWTGTIHKITTKIRACERDIAELRSWQASHTEVEFKSPQWERFEHAKTVEYDNERIQIWARHAKFKAYEEQLAMRRDEIEKIERRVARGELTRREADYLLRKLDEYFGEQDDRIFG